MDAAGFYWDKQGAFSHTRVSAQLRLVADDIYLEANLSAWSCIRFIESLVTELGFEKDVFTFNIVAEEASDIDDED